ncbi:glycosyltransferase family 4 protein [Vibrio cyclitrophicus]|uniref:glycosyltransferase family 4 protein n=1 Tax=Vibrio cyclitrophicus TaxID=47951 RepID=UPI000C857F46|nr:glycosyltransferase family 4 protein [Vibrio cyclitrophicus]PME75366.1 hypothetical protein BCV29_18635 [Vibrio cyclitrophicus]
MIKLVISIRKILKLLVYNLYWKFNNYKYLTDSDLVSLNFNKNSKLIVIHDMTKTGAPVLALNVVKEMNRQGFKVTVISKSHGELASEFSKYADLIICNNHNDLPLSISKSIKKNCNSVYVNSIVSSNWIPWFRKNEIKTILLVHELPNVIKMWNAESIAHSAFNLSSVIIFPSNFVKEKLEEYLKLNVKNSCRILTQGIYIKPRVDIGEKDIKASTFAKLNIPPHKKLIINVANGNYRKGLDLFIQLSSKLPDINFVWIGDIDNEFTRLMKHRDLGGNLYFPGYINDKELLLNIYETADLLALTSREEPFGTIVLESMNVGTPVIGFRGIGGFEDVVIDQETGFLVEAFNVDSMKDTIVHYFNHDTLANKVSNQAKDYVKSYNFVKYVSDLLNESK